MKQYGIDIKNIQTSYHDRIEYEDFTFWDSVYGKFIIDITLTIMLCLVITLFVLLVN
jgi:hypothetical protein